MVANSSSENPDCSVSRCPTPTMCRVPRADHVVAGAEHFDDRADRVGRSGRDGAIHLCAARDQSRDQRRRAGCGRTGGQSAPGESGKVIQRPGTFYHLITYPHQ